jgi:hypothetical protein
MSRSDDLFVEADLRLVLENHEREMIGKIDIVFLPKPLLEPPVQAFEQDWMAEGIAFMQGMFNWARREGESRSFPLEGVENPRSVAVDSP